MLRRVFRFALYGSALGISGSLGIAAGLLPTIGLTLLLRWLLAWGGLSQTRVEGAAGLVLLLLWGVAGVAAGAWLLRSRADETPP